MNRIIVNPQHLSRDEFLTPFDRIFDDLIDRQFPTFKEEVGVSFNKGSYPKVNVYEYDDKVGIIAEIPGLDKKDLDVEVEDGVLTISGEKSHGKFDEAKAKVLRRELKHSSFKRQFTLGELLDGGNINASFDDGILSIEIPKIEPKLPKKHTVKIA